MRANAFILVIYLELFILCNEIIEVITGNNNLKTLFDFSYYFVFIRIYLHFFSYFSFCIRKAKKIEK